MRAIEILCISGILKHAIAVSKDNRVFVIGENVNGQLCLSKKTRCVKNIHRGFISCFIKDCRSLCRELSFLIQNCRRKNTYYIYGQLLLKTDPSNDS